MWHAECDVNRAEMRRQADGAPPRKGISRYSDWRKTARPITVALFNYYALYLVGQYAGMGEALNLQALQASYVLEGIPRRLWPELSRRLLWVHSQIVATMPKKDR